MLSAELYNRKGKGGQKLLVQFDDSGQQPHIQQGSIGREGSLVLSFITMCEYQVRAIHGAIDRYLTLRAATHGTDFFSFCGTKTFGLALLTNRAKQIVSPGLLRVYKASNEHYGLT